MKELMEYREKLLLRLREAAGEFYEACKTYTDPFTKVDGEWTVHQIAFHVHGIHREVYGLRVRRTMNENEPEFKNFEPEAWMAEYYNLNEPLENILNEFHASMNELCDQLEAMPQEGWSRLGSHEALGKDLTLQLWAERGLAHIEEHLKALKSAQNM